MQSLVARKISKREPEDNTGYKKTLYSGGEKT